LLDRIRKEIEDRLEEVRAEEAQLLKLLKAMAPANGDTPAATAAASSRRTRSAGPTRARRAAKRSAKTAGRRAKSATSAVAATSRTAPGETKTRVLKALADGKAKTAGEVATASGLARGSVSTTLSKLAKAGDVVKADRGYTIPKS
jgi:DNA-binding transcriptional ArsR family regulator